MPNDANDELSGIEARTFGRLLDDAERFVPDDQSLMTGRRVAVVAGDDLAIGSAHAKRYGADEHRSAIGGRNPEFLELERIGIPGSTVSDRMEGTPTVSAENAPDAAARRLGGSATRLPTRA
jgi:hypothetical protein